MSKGLRLSEKWFERGLWLIAVVFAGFLIGLGSLVVGDLPRVERPISAEMYMDPVQLSGVRGQLADDTAKLQDNQDALDAVNRKLEKARTETESERESFDNWIATRTATQQQSQDAEVLKRTQKLDKLKEVERGYESQVSQLGEERVALEKVNSAHKDAEQKVTDAGQVGYDRAVLKMETRVFLLRLALTLPLLLIAGWLFVKKRKSSQWPFVWGFIFFALFAFFVELVPYLPSYGGYIRYVVGIVLTVLIGNYAIRALRRYLETQKAEEQKPEEERRKDLGYDVAQMRLSKRACPGCERPMEVTDATNNFCMHCGLLVFENCAQCGTRQTVFTHFCRMCGLTKKAPVATTAA